MHKLISFFHVALRLIQVALYSLSLDFLYKLFP